MATTGWNNGAECGALEGRYCVIGSGYTSGPGSVYTASTRSAQYYGLCAQPKLEAAIEEITNKVATLEAVEVKVSKLESTIEEKVNNKVSTLEAGILHLTGKFILVNTNNY